MKIGFETMKPKLRYIANVGNCFTKQQSYNDYEMEGKVNCKFRLSKVRVYRN